MVNQITHWIKDYTQSSGLKSLVVGISGGIDSALVSTLCCLTGIETCVVSLPINQKEDQLSRARKHSDWLKGKFGNVTFREIDLTENFLNFKTNFNQDELSDLSLANSKSRLRMTALYQIAGNRNGLVVGTGNKIEDFGVGFFTKYGDGGVDISPIADLKKSEVRRLAKELGIIDEIIEAKPTDGLWEEERTDEDQLGASYDELEWAMDYQGDSNKLAGRQKEVYEIYHRFHERNLHKMMPVPIYKN
jgi:NAD+ synthase